MESVAVVGGSGFLGSHLAAALHEKGVPVRIVSRAPHATAVPLPEAVERFPADLLEPKGLEPALAGVDTVVNVSGSYASQGKNNYAEFFSRGTLNLLAYAKRASVQRFVQVMSLHANRKSANPFFAAQGETVSLVLESGLDYTVVKTAPVYGKNDRFLSTMARMLITLPVAPELAPPTVKLQPVYVSDFVDGVLACLDAENAPRILKLAGVERLSHARLLEALMAGLEIRKPRLPLPQRLSRAGSWFYGDLKVWLSEAELSLLTTPHFHFEPRRENNRLPQPRHFEGALQEMLA